MTMKNNIMIFTDKTSALLSTNISTITIKSIFFVLTKYVKGFFFTSASLDSVALPLNRQLRLYDQMTTSVLYKD